MNQKKKYARCSAAILNQHRQILLQYYESTTINKRELQKRATSKLTLASMLEKDTPTESESTPYCSIRMLADHLCNPGRVLVPEVGTTTVKPKKKAGRKPLGATERVVVMVSPEHKQIFKKVGGYRWFRKQMDQLLFQEATRALETNRRNGLGFGPKAG